SEFENPYHGAQPTETRPRRSRTQPKSGRLARRGLLSSSVAARKRSAFCVGATAAGNIRFEADEHGTFARPSDVVDGAPACALVWHQPPGFPPQRSLIHAGARELAPCPVWSRGKSTSWASPPCW